MGNLTRIKRYTIATINKAIRERNERRRLAQTQKKIPDLNNRLKENAAIKDSKKGKRCFVLGNGPSIKKLDFELLANEDVFTVNQLARRNEYYLLNANYHVWADPIFFDVDPNKEENQELIESFFKIKTSSGSPICFLPIEAEDFAKKMGLSDVLDIRYFYAHKDFDYCTEDIDLTKESYSFGTVVQYAISIALYMGYSEIYLLGCETTGLLNTINNYLHRDIKDYAYDISKNESKRMLGMMKEYDMEHEFKSWGIVFHQYKLLNRYCIDRGVKLINCTPESIIDSLEYIELSKVLKQNM